MRSIGLRELRQHASRYLRLVQSGQSLQVTDRGRAIALLVPIPDGSTLERLVAAGRAETADGDLLELGPPLKPAKGAALPSKLLAAARTGER
ncbi:MAG: type II toxin-antitoxin system prevent-host-death family antitoxin [Planctomycetota bacterium]